MGHRVVGGHIGAAVVVHVRGHRVAHLQFGNFRKEIENDGEKERIKAQRSMSSVQKEKHIDVKIKQQNKP